MLILKNCPQDSQLLTFVKFCESKFEYKYPITIHFKPRIRGNAAGRYRSNQHLVEIDMEVARTKFDVFTTIAHEIRHVYQHMYDTPEWVCKSTKVRERDAHAWATATVEEFGGVNKNMDLWGERYKAKISWFDVIHEPN